MAIATSQLLDIPGLALELAQAIVVLIGIPFLVWQVSEQTKATRVSADSLRIASYLQLMENLTEVNRRVVDVEDLHDFFDEPYAGRTLPRHVARAGPKGAASLRASCRVAFRAGTSILPQVARLDRQSRLRCLPTPARGPDKDNEVHGMVAHAAQPMSIGLCRVRGSASHAIWQRCIVGWAYPRSPARDGHARLRRMRCRLPLPGGVIRGWPLTSGYVEAIMSTRALAAPASIHGSTRGGHGTLAGTLCEASLEVELRPAREVCCLQDRGRLRWDCHWPCTAGTKTRLGFCPATARCFSPAALRSSPLVRSMIPTIHRSGRTCQQLDKELAKSAWLSPLPSSCLAGGSTQPFCVSRHQKLAGSAPASEIGDWEAIPA